jgi:hypothetical protein
MNATILQKVFYRTFIVGVLFSLVLLVLLPEPIVVNYDVNGLPSGVGSKWVLIPVFLFLQGMLYLFLWAAPVCINHGWSAEVWKDVHGSIPLFDWFMPNSTLNFLQDEERMRKFRESHLTLLWFVGTMGILFLIGIQWSLAANNL